MDDKEKILKLEKDLVAVNLEKTKLNETISKLTSNEETLNKSIKGLESEKSVLNGQIDVYKDFLNTSEKDKKDEKVRKPFESTID